MTLPPSDRPTPAEEQQFWDGKWERERKVYPNAWAVRRGREVLEVIQSLNLQSPRVLDVGCGPGWFVEALAAISDPTGIDLSEEAVACARASYPSRTFMAGNFFGMSLEPGQFDVVVSQEVIAHVPDQLGFLGRIAEVLRPGGYVVLTTPNRFVLERASRIFPYGLKGHIEQYMGMTDFRALIGRRFSVLKAKTILPMGDQGILTIVNSSQLNRLLSFALSQDWLDRLKEKAGLGYMMLVLARKDR